MKITWLGHSCFQISHNGYFVVPDPYKPGSVPGLRPLNVSANMVLCSHSHNDHGFATAVNLIQNDAENPFTIETIHTFHDDVSGTKRGENTIHILKAEGVRVAHFGDLGCPLTQEQAAKLGVIDAVMVPIGGYYTLDAIQVKEELTKLNPAVILPMHYRSAEFGFDVLAELSSFTNLFDAALVKKYDSNTIEIGKGNVKEIAVLKLMK